MDFDFEITEGSKSLPGGVTMIKDLLKIIGVYLLLIALMLILAIWLHNKL